MQLLSSIIKNILNIIGYLILLFYGISQIIRYLIIKKNYVDAGESSVKPSEPDL